MISSTFKWTEFRSTKMISICLKQMDRTCWSNDWALPIWIDTNCNLVRHLTWAWETKFVSLHACCSSTLPRLGTICYFPLFDTHQNKGKYWVITQDTKGKIYICNLTLHLFTLPTLSSSPHPIPEIKNRKYI